MEKALLTEGIIKPLRVLPNKIIDISHRVSLKVKNGLTVPVFFVYIKIPLICKLLLSAFVNQGDLLFGKGVV